MPRSGNDVILAALKRRSHTTDELLWECIHKRGKGAIVHSRVAELRGRGHEIRCEREGRTYRYWLLSAGKQAA